MIGPPPAWVTAHQLTAQLKRGQNAADRGTIACSWVARGGEAAAAEEGFKSEVAWIFNLATSE